MKIINTKLRSVKQLTAILVGDSRAGKTHFAATWPRPLFLMDNSEHGWTTIQYMDPEQWYEPGRTPNVIAIEEPADLLQCLVALREQAAGSKPSLKDWPLPVGKDEVGTVVIDSLTFYADAYFSQLEAVAASGKTVDKRQLYGDLHSHLRYLMIQMHKLPYNILWTALPKEGDNGVLGGALVAGQTATKAPARCDLWLLCNKIEKQKEVFYEVRTESYRGLKAGHRFGQLLKPVMAAHYDAFQEALGLAPWTDRLEKTNKKAAKAASNRASAQ